MKDGKIILVVERDETGHYVGGSFVLKKFERQGKKVVLHSLNKDYPDIILQDAAEYSVKYAALAEFHSVV